MKVTSLSIDENCKDNASEKSATIRPYVERCVWQKGKKTIKREIRLCGERWVWQKGNKYE